MKKFKFRLESLLKYRSELDRQAQLELAQLREEEAQMKRTIEEIKEKQKVWEEEYNKDSNSEENQQWSLWIEPYLISLDQTRIQSEQILFRHQSKVFHASLKAEESYKAKRQVEILKDKDYQNYVQEMNRLEQKQNAEISTIRFVRQQNEDWRTGHES